MLLDLYTDISNSTLPILSRDTTIELLKSKGYIVGLNSDLGEICEDIIKLQINFHRNVHASKVYIDTEGNYNCDMELESQSNDTHLLNTKRNKTKRNSILMETDWIESSDAVTPTTKLQYQAYRQYLRDIFQYQDVLEYIDFPPSPSISMKVEKNSKLSHQEVKKLKEYVSKDDNPGWYLFFNEWQKCQFTSNRTLTNTLLKAYTSLSLTQLLA
jgi:hypothetical protein